MIKRWEKTPDFIRLPEVLPYWKILRKKQFLLLIKKIFDLFTSFLLLIILALPMVIIALVIKKDSKGTVFYRQIRVTAYGKRFRIHKFRTMVSGADKIGSAVTVSGDKRITKVGAFLRRFRLDELPQLIDILQGNMSFVGTRPEAEKYVEQYLPEYMATLLLPAGITSEASINFKDEQNFISSTEDADKTYLEKILPEKMKWNLDSIKHFSLFSDFKTMLKTVIAVFRK